MTSPMLAKNCITAARFEPAYLRLYESGELKRRVERALEALRSCEVCPRDCGVDRLADKFAVCKTGRYAVVGSYFAHFGEEDCLRGSKGSGTIFFSGCNLRCVFCQNFDISWQLRGTPRSEEHTSELQSLAYLVCRLLLEKKKKIMNAFLLRRIHYRSNK